MDEEIFNLKYKNKSSLTNYFSNVSITYDGMKFPSRYFEVDVAKYISFWIPCDIHISYRNVRVHVCY